VQFDFENNKKLMMRIEKEIKEEKEMETKKRTNKEVKEIIIKRENMIFKFRKGLFKLN